MSFSASSDDALPIENSPPGIQTMPEGAGPREGPVRATVGSKVAAGAGPRVLLQADAAISAANAAVHAGIRFSTATIYRRIIRLSMHTSRLARIALALLALPLVFNAAEARQAATRPNIVLIVPDNLG